MRTLIANVYIDPDWWGPAYGNADRVPADVAEKITNPDVWADIEPAQPPAPVVEDISGLDDETLSVWVNDHKADEVIDAVALAISHPLVPDAAKYEFVERVLAGEAAGKDRKGVAEHLQTVLEDLTAPGTPPPSTGTEV